MKGIRNIACLNVPEFAEGCDEYYRKFLPEWFVFIPVMSPDISTLRCRSPPFKTAEWQLNAGRDGGLGAFLSCL